MKKCFYLFILVWLISITGYSQNNINASLGVGLPELFNIGVRYELPPQFKIGMSAGTVFTGAFSLSGDVYYHFAGHSQLNNMPPWYLRANMTYWQLGKIFFINPGQAVLLGFRIGRDFNVTEKFGVAIDGGIVPISFLSGRKIPFSFIPSISISIYNRFTIRNPAGSRN